MPWSDDMVMGLTKLGGIQYTSFISDTCDWWVDHSNFLLSDLVIGVAPFDIIRTLLYSRTRVGVLGSNSAIAAVLSPLFITHTPSTFGVAYKFKA